MTAPKNIWYWYVARPNELMVDLDSPILLQIALKRLNKPELDIKPRNVFVADSNAKDHYHMVVLLESEIPDLWRMLFQLYLMDHVYRSVRNFERTFKHVKCPSLLISPHNWLRNGVAIHSTPNHGKFWRNPDATCNCLVQRHKSHTAILKCPAHIKFRGENS